MHSKANLNRFERQLYRNMLEYWEKLAGGVVDFESKEHLALVKHLELIPQDYRILKELHKERL